MEFWGVEVKPGQSLSCDAGNEFIIHLSQAALGETEKESGNTVVSAKVGGNKVVIGTLSAENRPQIQFDLVFEKEFELSHSSETASVFVCGYKLAILCVLDLLVAFFTSDSSKDKGEVNAVNNQVINPTADEDDSDSSDSDSSSLDDLSSSDDDLTEDESSTEGDSSEEDDTSTEEDDSSSEEIYTSSEEIATSSEEDSSDEESKSTPVKPEDGKKRVAETALKTPASDKKAKVATPSCQTTGDDKNVPHVATPTKEAGKASGNSNGKPKAKSPKSVGTHACKSCRRTFGSDFALQSHEKAKHT
ncbi:histone deacetylase HDT2-like [Lolium rigidum]|uniref:histone deacetylase HDT2-like n=1 Tax=Lolium rigidum TaxID=89674 RepID=UPI001F5D31CB|nr:histone deacetylase HDT2-like [Lolium rigidum]